MIEKFQPANPDRFAAAIRRFDEMNSADPNREEFEGANYPRELIYARWLSEWVSRISPAPSEELRLASRCQHLCRWMIPRSSYPMTRPGYLRWREELKKFHAEKAGAVLRDLGYPKSTIQRVQSLNLKKSFPADAESRVLEDALCLVFLEHQLADLADKTSDDKVINALKKSWDKMTPQAHAIAKSLKFELREKRLIETALAPAT